MADASRWDHGFAPTLQLDSPPDVPAPTGPLHDIQIPIGPELFRSRNDTNPKGLAGAARWPATAEETTQRGAGRGAGDDARRDGGPASPRGLLTPVIGTPARIEFPDPEKLERERAERMKRAANRERTSILDSTTINRIISAATKEASRRGFNIGHAEGYSYGWYWGLAFGLVVGSGLTYFCMRVGFWIGSLS